MGLRDEFRAPFRAGKSQEVTLSEVVWIVAVMGRLRLLGIGKPFTRTSGVLVTGKHADVAASSVAARGLGPVGGTGARDYRHARPRAGPESARRRDGRCSQFPEAGTEAEISGR